ncbi:MAG: AAA family ATPase [Nocardioides sp.]|nr:AAA family ATPase [Nocardioides sp.]
MLVAASVAASGWPVIPLRRDTRTPVGPGGERHRSLWHLNPMTVATTAETRHGLGTSWGVVLGEANPDGWRLVVLDTDSADAETRLRALLDDLGDDARDWAAGTFTVRTARGLHRYGVTRESLMTAPSGPWPGLDLKAAGGYVVLPGCWHPSGVLYTAETDPGRVVEFTDGHHPAGSLFLGVADPDDDGPAVAWGYPLPVPAALLDALRWPHEDDHTDDGAGQGETVTPASRKRPALTRHGDISGRLDGLARAVETAPPGEGNARLNWAAGKAAAVCSTDDAAPAADDVRGALVAAYLARPLPPGESLRSRETEAHRTVASGWRWGSTHPEKALVERRDGHDDHGGHDGHHDEDGGGAVPLHEVTGPTPVTDEAPTTTPEHRRRLVLTPASAIKPKRVRWLWSDRIALGSLALLAGREGLGKSSVAYDTAARITLGTLPGEFHGEPHAVLVCATEDSWAHTIVPRLIAAGADLDRIYRVEVETSEGLHGTLSLPRDLDGVEEGARETDAALLILDPLTSRLTEALDTHKDSDVRRALEPLSALADRSGLAVWGLMHHNKSGSTDPLSLVMGSRAFTAVARSVHTVVPDPDDDSVRFFGTPKNNLGRTDLPTLSFTVESFAVPTDDGPATVGRVVWGDEVRGSIGEAMRRSAARDSGGGGGSATDEAADWLLDYLTAYGKPDESLSEGRWVESSRVKEAAADAGHGDKPLRAARNRLGVLSESVGFPRRTWWSLPPKRSRDLSRAPSRGEVTTDMTGHERAGQHSRVSRDHPGGTGTTEGTTDGEVLVSDRWGRSVEVVGEPDESPEVPR